MSGGATGGNNDGASAATFAATADTTEGIKPETAERATATATATRCLGSDPAASSPAAATASGLADSAEHAGPAYAQTENRVTMDAPAPTHSLLVTGLFITKLVARAKNNEQLVLWANSFIRIDLQPRVLFTPVDTLMSDDEAELKAIAIPALQEALRECGLPDKVMEVAGPSKVFN